MWKPNFCDARLTPGLESVDPCGPLGHLSGDLSSQVREKGHLDTGAGINVQSCQKTKGNISKGGFLLLQTFRINHSTPHATLFCKWSSWSPITEVLKRGFAGRGRQGATPAQYPKHRLPQISRKLYSLLETEVYRLIKVCMTSPTSLNFVHS